MRSICWLIFFVLVFANFSLLAEYRYFLTNDTDNPITITPTHKPLRIETFKVDLVNGHSFFLKGHSTVLLTFNEKKYIPFTDRVRIEDGAYKKSYKESHNNISFMHKMAQKIYSNQSIKFMNKGQKSVQITQWPTMSELIQSGVTLFDIAGVGYISYILIRYPEIIEAIYYVIRYPGALAIP